MKTLTTLGMVLVLMAAIVILTYAAGRAGQLDSLLKCFRTAQLDSQYNLCKRLADQSLGEVR